MRSRRTSASVADLQGWRKRKNISLETIAGSSKIGMRYLEAIEQGNFKVLPGGIYSVSYLRQYAEAVDYDADALVDQFHKAMGPQENRVDAAGIPADWMTRFRAYIRSLRAFTWHGGTPAARG